MINKKDRLYEHMFLHTLKCPTFTMRPSKSLFLSIITGSWLKRVNGSRIINQALISPIHSTFICMYLRYRLLSFIHCLKYTWKTNIWWLSMLGIDSASLMFINIHIFICKNSSMLEWKLRQYLKMNTYNDILNFSYLLC